MKKLFTLAAVSSLLLGCAYHQTLENTHNPQTGTIDTTRFTGIVWFNKTATEGLVVGKRTATGSTTLSVTKASTETQADALRAVAEGAAAGAVKGARP